ncbi:oxygen-insensitive NADPH nitroreductase [Exiguobacterium flavidum]|uniref:oxygen-insensitive NADPH nitroreductase n=1 Tax=Exiguobacterium flavidum TaxID=2184695 RepID=UPI000DF7C6B6|nr:oxygen-insensitive NADPH nitroreductase [Exiguobacterium flavidum]
MNETIQTILNHRSIRKFKSDPLDDETVRLLVEAAQAASTSSYQQAYAIIGVDDAALKRSLMEVASQQSYVAENGYFFVFCIDYHKHAVAAAWQGSNLDATIESTEALIVGTVDASLAAQNLVVAAESLGYGAVYIGSLRNDAKKVSELLALPNQTVPLFGVAIGLPDHSPGKKPRLPMEAVFHRNRYTEDDKLLRFLQEYEEKTAAYYTERTDGQRSEGWVSQIVRTMLEPKRKYLRDFLRDRKFLKD